MQPINYGVEIQDPTQSFLSAFQTGTAIQDTRLKQEQQQQKVAQQKLIQDGFAKLRLPGATAADYANLAMVLPETEAKAVRESFSMLSGERQQNALQQSGQVFSAFKAGKPEIAIGLLDRQIEAKRNSGDNEGAKFLETWRDVAKENPKATEDYFGYTISQMPGGDKVIKSAVEFGGERRDEAQAPSKLRASVATADKAVADADKALSDAITAQFTATNAPEKAAADAAKATADAAKAAADAQKAQVDAKFAEQLTLADLKKKAADLGLTSAQTGSALAQTRKLNSEIAKAALELEVLKANGGVDPEKKFTQEEKIRKEWQGRSKMYGELQGTFNTLQASASSANGPGDIALITGFMKMLDPGSVVRETEFATARDTAGLFTQLQNRLEKAQNGQLLSPQQRKEYVALSQKYLDSAQTKANQEKKDLGIVVKNYKLNPENVFGAERPATPPPAPLPASATVGGKTYPRPAAFTDAQWSDYLKANGVIQ
jgi:hypothetical protein